MLLKGSPDSRRKMAGHALVGRVPHDTISGWPKGEEGKALPGALVSSGRRQRDLSLEPCRPGVSPSIVLGYNGA